jgi:hypothetical protein
MTLHEFTVNQIPHMLAAVLYQLHRGISGTARSSVCSTCDCGEIATA